MAQRPRRNPANKLERWEIALIKRTIAADELNDQDILAYFTRPTPSTNHARIAEIRGDAKHRSVPTANREELDAFLSSSPQIDPTTGLHLRGDQLLVKAREAMLHAVLGFNMDQALPAEDMDQVREIIDANMGSAIEAHDVRTRHAGRITFIDLHLIVDGGMQVAAAHDICDRIEAALRERFPDVIASIHVEPPHKCKATGRGTIMGG